MGYIPNFLPSSRWFAGRAFLEKSKIILEKYKDIEEFEIDRSLETLSNLFLAKLNIIRGIRTSLLLPAGKDTDLKNLVIDIKEKISDEIFNEFYNTYFHEFEVQYFGMYQTIPDYTFLYQGNRFKYIHPSEELKKVINLAIKERLENLEKLIDIATQIFFEIYIEDKKDEIFYYSFAETHEEYEVYEVLVENGIASSIEEVINKFGEDPFEIESQFPELFEKEILDSAKMEHDYYFWEWDESKSILYQHSN